MDNSITHTSIYQQPLKPVIIAICGKSATGKDTLAKLLKSNLNGLNIKTKMIVSDTTRSPRLNEKDGEDYYFIEERSFQYRKNMNLYLECTSFKNWHYGIRKSELENAEVYIVVINPKGLENFKKYRRQYQIIPIYLKNNLFYRLRRSYERESKWRIEYFRRAFFDWLDFIKINKIIGCYSKHIILQNEESLTKKVRKTLFGLQQFNIIAAG